MGIDKAMRSSIRAFSDNPFCDSNPDAILTTERCAAPFKNASIANAIGDAIEAIKNL